MKEEDTLSQIRYEADSDNDLLGLKLNKLQMTANSHSSSLTMDQSPSPNISEESWLQDEMNYETLNKVKRNLFKGTRTIAKPSK